MEKTKSDELLLKAMEIYASIRQINADVNVLNDIIKLQSNVVLHGDVQSAAIKEAREKIKRMAKMSNNALDLIDELATIKKQIKEDGKVRDLLGMVTNE